MISGIDLSAFIYLCGVGAPMAAACALMPRHEPSYCFEGDVSGERREATMMLEGIIACRGGRKGILSPGAAQEKCSSSLKRNRAFSLSVSRAGEGDFMASSLGTLSSHAHYFATKNIRLNIQSAHGNRWTAHDVEASQCRSPRAASAP